MGKWIYGWRRAAFERTITRFGRFGTTIVASAIEGAVEGATDTLLQAFGAERLNLFIDNDWNIIASVYYNLRGFEPDYSKMNLSDKEKQRAEKIRRSEFLKRLVIPALERARWLASKFTSKLIEDKVTAEWLMKKGDENRPILADVIRSRGEQGQRWLEKQAEEFRLYFTNKLMWSDADRRMVRVEPTESRGAV